MVSPCEAAEQDPRAESCPFRIGQEADNQSQRPKSLGKLRDDAVAGELGVVIPKSAGAGQAVVVFHSRVKRKLVANAYVQELSTGETIVFGCSSCPPDLVSVNLSPNTIEGFVGNQEGIMVIATFSNFFQKDVTALSSYSVGNLSIADEPVFGSILLKAVGGTSLTASYSECKYKPPLPGEGTACDCGLITITRQDTSTVNVYMVYIQVEAGMEFGAGAGFVVRSASRTLTTNLTATVNGPGSPNVAYQWSLGAKLAFQGPSTTQNISVSGTAPSADAGDTFVKVTATISGSSSMASIPFTVREPAQLSNFGLTGGPQQTTQVPGGGLPNNNHLFCIRSTP